MDTSIPAGTHIVGTHEDTDGYGYHIYLTGRGRVSYYPYPWVPIDIPSPREFSSVGKENA